MTLDEIVQLGKSLERGKHLTRLKQAKSDNEHLHALIDLAEQQQKGLNELRRILLNHHGIHFVSR